MATLVVMQKILSLALFVSAAPSVFQFHFVRALATTYIAELPGGGVSAANSLQALPLLLDDEVSYLQVRNKGRSRSSSSSSVIAKQARQATPPGAEVATAENSPLEQEAQEADITIFLQSPEAQEAAPPLSESGAGASESQQDNSPPAQQEAQHEAALPPSERRSAGASESPQEAQEEAHDDAAAPPPPSSEESSSAGVSPSPSHCIGRFGVRVPCERWVPWPLVGGLLSMPHIIVTHPSVLYITEAWERLGRYQELVFLPILFCVLLFARSLLFQGVVLVQLATHCARIVSPFQCNPLLWCNSCAFFFGLLYLGFACQSLYHKDEDRQPINNRLVAWLVLFVGLYIIVSHVAAFFYYEHYRLVFPMVEWQDASPTA